MRRGLVRLSIAAALALAAACGSSSSPTTPSATTTPTTTTPTPAPAPVPTTSVKYAGTFAGTGYVGSFTIAADIPTSVATVAAVPHQATTSSATCTLHFSGSAVTNTVTGTYDSATKTFTCSIAALSLTATIQNDGAVTGSSRITLPDGTQQSGVAAGASTTASTAIPTHLCGTFTGGAGGRITMTVTGNNIVGTAWDNGAKDGTYIKGTINGAIVRVTWSFDQNGSGEATGAISAGGLFFGITGTWSNSLGEHGSWVVSNGC